MSRRRRLLGVFSFVLTIALGCALGIFAVFTASFLTEGIDESYSAPFFFYFFSASIFALLCLVVSILIHVPLHEIGHLVFGLISGYRFLSFRIGSFMLMRGERGLRFKRFSLFGTAGQCLMAPRIANTEKMPTFIYNVGGGLMNLIVSVLMLGIGFILNDYKHLFVFSLCFAASGLNTALTNLIPMRIGGIANDGYNTLTLMKNPAERKALSVQLAANEATAHGKRLSELPDEWFYEIADGRKGIHTSAHAYLCAQRLLDFARLDEAKKMMTVLLNSGSDLLPIYEGLMRNDLAFLEAHFTKDLQKAQSILTPWTRKLMKAMHKYPTVIRSEYALSMLRGDARSAEKLLSKFEKVAKSYPNPAEIETERALLAAFDEGLNRKIQAQGV